MSIKLIALLGFLLLISVSVTVKLIADNQTLREEKNQLVDYSLADSKQIEWYKNKLGQTTSRVSALELSSRNIKDLKNDPRFETVKSFRGVKKNLKNVESLTTTSLLYFDTVKVFVPHGSIEGDTLETVCKDSTVLTGAAIWHRKWILGRKRWTFDVSSSNSKFKVTGLEHISIRKK